MLEIPILRGGRPYTSIEKLELVDYATGDPVARVNQANYGLVARDLLIDAWTELQDLSVAENLERMAVAADHFLDGELPVGDTGQTADDFVALQSATTGLPHALCRQNMRKVEAALRNMGTILDGLTGGLDLAVLDRGYGERDGHTVSYGPKARRFGGVLPANSPGVHALWPPALALKMPVALKPGQREPWTPLRVLEALRRAGHPAAALGFYPCGHDGAGAILRRCGAAMIFGSGSTVKPWRHDPRVEIHGPGNSKILLGPDQAHAWPIHLDLLATSVAANGGRSCINASAIRTTTAGRQLAEALAERLAATIQPCPRQDPEAVLSAFPDPQIAHAIDQAIERELAQGGAEDLSARYRDGARLVERHGGAYLLPTVIWCDSPDHPLADLEYLFPFVSVAESPAKRMVKDLGPSLVVTALTEEPAICRQLLATSTIGRLNLGPIPTNIVQWDQPHEGNLFELLYQPRALQHQPFAAVEV